VVEKVIRSWIKKEISHLTLMQIITIITVLLVFWQTSFGYINKAAHIVKNYDIYENKINMIERDYATKNEVTIKIDKLEQKLDKVLMILIKDK
jgi:hypothetical protein